MKKVSFCIGVFMVLFLAFGVYAAPAQQGDLRDFNGTWLKLTIKPQKGLEFTTGYNSTDAPAKMKASAGNIYACMDVDDQGIANGQAYLRLFDKEGTTIGYGWINWDAGTNLEFLGYLYAYIASDTTYTAGVEGSPGSVLDTWLYGYVSVKGKEVDKIKIQSVSGEGYTYAPDSTETTGNYAGFGYILNGGFTKDNKIPEITPACGAIDFTLWPPIL
jgi:hypothetical protein